MATSEIRERYSVRRMKKLLNHDNIRLTKFFEMIQYTVLYSVLGFFTALLFELTMPTFSSQKGIFLIVTEIIIQLCLCSIAIFYIKKIVKIIPLLFPYPKKYKAYQTPEYITGGTALVLMFITIQATLFKKIEHLRRWVGKVN